MGFSQHLGYREYQNGLIAREIMIGIILMAATACCNSAMIAKVLKLY